MATYVSAIGFQHKLSGVSDPTGTFVIQKLLQATKYDRRSLDTRLPITEPLLMRLSQATSCTIGNDYHRVLFNCMMSLAFLGFFRVGELTGKGDKAIQIEDLSFAVEGRGISSATIILSSYKHNRGGIPFRVVLEASELLLICPVKSLQSYLGRRQPGVGPLLVFPDGSSVSRSWFASQLNGAIRFCGLDLARYKSHSFRIGAATSAVAKGWTDAQIRYKGRWHSDAFKKYIRLEGL